MVTRFKFLIYILFLTLVVCLISCPDFKSNVYLSIAPSPSIKIIPLSATTTPSPTAIQTPVFSSPAILLHGRVILPSGFNPKPSEELLVSPAPYIFREGEFKISVYTITDNLLAESTTNNVREYSLNISNPTKKMLIQGVYIFNPSIVLMAYTDVSSDNLSKEIIVNLNSKSTGIAVILNIAKLQNTNVWQMPLDALTKKLEDKGYLNTLTSNIETLLNRHPSTYIFVPLPYVSTVQDEAKKVIESINL